MLLNDTALNEVPINGATAEARRRRKVLAASPPYRINPLTGMNRRGFFEGPYKAPVEKDACRLILERSLPENYSIQSFRYKPWGVPRDSVVEVVVNTPCGADTLEFRVPIDNYQRTWGGRIPKVMSDFLRATYP